MKIKNIFSAIMMATLVLVAPMTFTACDGDDQLDTNQFSESVSLLAFGPCPVARGGELQIVGTGLDQAQSVELPGCGPVTDITRISKEKITIIVPKTAQPGNIVLHTSKGDFASKTKISYTEPVGFAESNAVSPSPVKPGQTLTIKGTYLNLVQSVIFADDVVVTELAKSSADEPMDMTIQVVVPAEAQTGKIFLGFIATGDTIMNKVISPAELEVVLPSVKEIANLNGKKPEDKIELEGSNLDLVTKLTVADTEIDFAVADNKISFVLPLATPDAAEIAMYPASGIKVVIATIGMTVPSELVATPAKELRNGDEVVISGKDLDVVEKVTFPGVAAAATFTYADGKISVKCPEGFVSGEVVLTCKSGIDVKVAIETQKPAFESFEEAEVSMGSNVVIKGQNLDLVAKVVYAGDKEGEVMLGGTATQIVVTMPASGIESGKITLVMANGETAETGALTVNAPVFAYALDPSALLAYAEQEIHAGSIVSFEIDNADKLTAVTVDGEECQYILKETMLYVLTPDNAGLSSKLVLISSNGEIEYPIALLPNSEIVTTLWKGAAELGWSGEGQVYLGQDGGQQLIDAGAKAGDILRIKFEPTADDWAIQIWEGHWSTMYAEINAGNYDLAGNNNYYNIELTDELLATFTTSQGWGGIVLTQGQSAIVTALELFQKIELAETIWQGEFAAGGWAQGMQDLSWGKYDWASNVKVGTTLTVYFNIDPAAEYDPAIRLGNGSWVALPSTKRTYGDADGDGNIPCTGKDYVEIKLQEDDINELVNNGGLVVCGAWFIVTKITIQ